MMRADETCRREGPLGNCGAVEARATMVHRKVTAKERNGARLFKICIGYANGVWMQTRSADKGVRSGSWSDIGTSRVDCLNDGSQWSVDHIKAIMNMNTWN